MFLGITILEYCVNTKMPKSLHFIERRRSAGESITDVESSSLTSGTASQLISNGICSFNPTSTKGKWIFIIQTTILTFCPISILLAQNGYSFYTLMIEKEQIFHKSNLVTSFLSIINVIVLTNSYHFYFRVASRFILLEFYFIFR